MIPAVYNANMRILQSPGFVAISYELIHDTRVIPLDAASPRGSLSPAIRTYMGDAHGRWDGTTLVVETSNLKANTRGASPGLRLIERFTRTGRDAIDYQVTFVDPGTWTAPWTAALDMKARRDDAGVFDTRATKGTTACSTCSPPRGCPTNRAGRPRRPRRGGANETPPGRRAVERGLGAAHQAPGTALRAVRLFTAVRFQPRPHTDPHGPDTLELGGDLIAREHRTDAVAGARHHHVAGVQRVERRRPATSAAHRESCRAYGRAAGLRRSPPA